MRSPRFPKRRNRARRAIDNRLAVPGSIEPAALFCGARLVCQRGYSAFFPTLFFPRLSSRTGLGRAQREDVTKIVRCGIFLASASSVPVGRSGAASDSKKKRLTACTANR